MAVRSHFGNELPESSGNSGRRIKGDELLPSWDPTFPFSGGLRPPEPPAVFVIVSDIRDSEIQDRIRVLYSYSYLRGSYEIEADLTTQQLQHATYALCSTRRVQHVPQL